MPCSSIASKIRLRWLKLCRPGLVPPTESLFTNAEVCRGVLIFIVSKRKATLRARLSASIAIDIIAFVVRVCSGIVVIAIHSIKAGLATWSDLGGSARIAIIVII